MLFAWYFKSYFTAIMNIGKVYTSKLDYNYVCLSSLHICLSVHINQIYFQLHLLLLLKCTYQEPIYLKYVLKMLYL